MSDKYFSDWQSREDVVKDYGDNVPPEDDIVYACYTYESYEGNALVVFRRDGKLYENNDSHCSCNGLENWEPEETSVAALLMRKHWEGLHRALAEGGLP